MNLETRWRPRRQIRWSELPASLRGWLFDAGSLTRRLKQICPSQFRVKVLGQCWARPLRGESRALGVRCNQRVWIREVQLLCGAHAWVFARTLIPRSTLRRRCQRLKHLGTRPLGEVLFTDPAVRRVEVEVARIGVFQCLHSRAFGTLEQVPVAIWGRRSVFEIDGWPLLVCEIFLPDLLGPVV